MKNQYETTLIFTPVLSEDELREAIKTYRKFLESNGAEIVHEEKWGLRQLAYPIKKKTTGIYHLFEYRSETGLIDKLELNVRRDESIVRFLTVRLDKYAMEFSEKRRLGLAGPNKRKSIKDEAVAESEGAPVESTDQI